MDASPLASSNTTQELATTQGVDETLACMERETETHGCMGEPEKTAETGGGRACLSIWST